MHLRANKHCTIRVGGGTMRSIYVEDGLRVSFPGRNEEFGQGVEIGIAIALMAAGQDFTVWLSADSIEQANELAAGMNFHTVPLGACGESRQVGFRRGLRRPIHLKLVARQM
jgi:hypothetical protein